MSNVYFESPDLLYLLGVVPLQALLLWAYWRWRQRTLRRLGSPALETRLLQGFSAPRFWAKNLMFALGVVLVIMALASPVYMEKIEAGEQMSADVVIALDVSNSMLATDVKPSRLDQAKAFIQQLVPSLSGERVGLVFFAGKASPQMPLSNDLEALLMFSRNAQPDIITDQGTDIGSAIETCRRMLETDQKTGRAILLISDGENHEEKALQRVREANQSGVLIFPIGVGTTGAASIPAGGNTVRRDGMGNPVRSSANEALMRSIAEAGGGEALNLRNPGAAISTIKNAVSRLQKSAVTQQAKTEKVYFFPWFLLIALILLVAEQVMWWKKKGVVTAIVLVFSLQLSAQSDHLVLRQGERYYDQGNFEKAQSTYQKSNSNAARFNAGNAAYLQSDYDLSAQLYREAAERSLSVTDKADAYYNLGNTYLLKGEYRAAIDAYERSLRLVPKRSDAQKNLQIAKHKLEPPPPPPSPPPPPPPPSVRPRQQYLDRAASARLPDIPPVNLPPSEARRLLDHAVRSEEEKNAGTYRELAPSNRPSRLKKDW